MTEKVTKNGYRAGVDGRLMVTLCVLLAVIMTVVLWYRAQEDAVFHPRRGQGQDFNVLLITLDTTRMDSLGCYGHPVIQTPHIDALAREGARFTQCSSSAPITLPSHASIMTSTYPFVHRARNNGRYLIDKSNLTLAELLKTNGYTTGAEVAAYVLNAMWGLDQGFDSYRGVEKGSQQSATSMENLEGWQSQKADVVCNRATEWLQQNGLHRFFLWVHFFDPHLPLTPPKKFEAQYDDPYLAEIAFVDEQIGRLMGELRRMKLDKHTLVVLTADHGEGRGQHREDTHAYYIYDSTMSVPLVFWCPAVIPAGRWIDCQVRTVDIAPTVLALLGMAEQPGFQGRSLLPLLAGETTDLGLGAYGESVLAHETHGYGQLWFYRADGWKYIHAPAAELYDLSTDPGETVNIAARHPDRVADMRRQLEGLIARSVSRIATGKDTTQLDPKVIENLAALGYIGGFVPPSAKNELDHFLANRGPDPKDHIDTFIKSVRAEDLVHAGHDDQGRDIFRELIAAEPTNPHLRMWMSFNLSKDGQSMAQLAESLEHFEVLLRLQPDNGLAHFRMGLALVQLGRHQESLDHLQRAVEVMPQKVYAYEYLAVALAQVGKTGQAEDRFRQALALGTAGRITYTGLADIAQQEGRWHEAAEILRDGLIHLPKSAPILNNLAWLLATAPVEEIRDGNEAIRLAEFARQLLGSDEPSILDTLGAAYAETGEFELAVGAARRAVKLLESAGFSELAKQVRSRLDAYEAHQPYREGS